MAAVNPGHPMSQIAEENATTFIAAMIWKLRKHCPNLAVELTQKDLEELGRVFNSGGQRGTIVCIGKSDRIILQLVDGASGRALAADDSLNENSDNAKTMRRMLDARARAPSVAARLAVLPARSSVSSADRLLVDEAVEILKLLTWEPSE
jgi:hypothetical protein